MQPELSGDLPNALALHHHCPENPGNRKVSWAELYELMVQEADGLLKAIEGGNLGEDVMREVMRLTGVDDLGELNPG